MNFFCAIQKENLESFLNEQHASQFNYVASRNSNKKLQVGTLKYRGVKKNMENNLISCYIVYSMKDCKKATMNVS